jgi:hypothetical protein
MATHKGGKKNRKFGRNVRSPAAKRYKAEGRRERNKERTARRVALAAAKRVK